MHGRLRVKHTSTYVVSGPSQMMMSSLHSDYLPDLQLTVIDLPLQTVDRLYMFTPVDALSMLTTRD